LNAVFLNGLGNAYQALGEYDKAIEYHQQHLAIWQESQECQAEAIAVGNLGNAYWFLGEYTKAIGYYSRLQVNRVHAMNCINEF
jgi:tetratricopeptide (TPR) repeat protein